MAPPLKLSLLGCRRFCKLIQPLSIRHGGPPCGATGPIEPWLGCGSVHTVFFQEGDGILVIGTIIPTGCVFDPSSQRRLRLLSGTPQRAMEPLETASGFCMGDKAATAEKHFVVILGGATQFHLGGEPAMAFQLSSLQLGSHSGMGVFFQCLQHHLTELFEQIHGTPFLGTLVP